MLTTKLIITEQDYERLSLLIQHIEGEGSLKLGEELSRADVVSQAVIPSDIVTMNSTVIFVDEVSGKSSEITLVYPKDADVTKNRVSILAPVGTALLGLQVGQSIDWPMPGGKIRILRVEKILYQPEALGHWDL
jgi:regulator of nucleoside diphosphate kinase